jgi:hypothetical protein
MDKVQEPRNSLHEVLVYLLFDIVVIFLKLWILNVLDVCPTRSTLHLSPVPIVLEAEWVSEPV